MSMQIGRTMSSYNEFVKYINVIKKYETDLKNNIIPEKPPVPPDTLMITYPKLAWLYASVVTKNPLPSDENFIFFNKNQSTLFYLKEYYLESYLKNDLRNYSIEVKLLNGSFGLSLLEYLIENNFDLNFYALKYSLVKNDLWLDYAKQNTNLHTVVVYALSQNAASAVWYAKEVVKGRWRQGENTILASSVSYIVDYCSSVINGRWEDGERVILEMVDKQKISKQVIKYISTVIKNRWEEFENVVFGETKDSSDYYYKRMKELYYKKIIEEFCDESERVSFLLKYT